MRLLWPHSMLIEPYMPDGFTQSGIYLQHHRGLRTPYGRVLETHPECLLRQNDFVVFKKHDPLEMPYDKQKPYTLWDWQVMAVLTKNDGSPWFEEKVTCRSTN